jgi:acyl carrier protein
MPAGLSSLQPRRSGLPPPSVSESAIRDWCIAFLKQTADPSIVIAADATFAQMGLDSASAAYFIVELEEWLGIELEPELVFDYPTIADLARHLAAAPGASDAGAG